MTVIESEAEVKIAKAVKMGHGSRFVLRQPEIDSHGDKTGYVGAIWSDGQTTEILRCYGRDFTAGEYGQFAQFGNFAKANLYNRNATDCTVFRCANISNYGEGGSVACNTAPLWVSGRNFTDCHAPKGSAIYIWEGSSLSSPDLLIAAFHRSTGH
jgi:hypothetical protein